MNNEKNDMVSHRCLQELTEAQKLELFTIEELEGRAETAWNNICPVNNGCIIEEEMG